MGVALHLTGPDLARTESRPMNDQPTNDQPTRVSSLTPDEALSLNEGDRLLHEGTVVYVQKVENGFGLLSDGEAMIWAETDGGEGRGISVRREQS